MEWKMHQHLLLLPDHICQTCHNTVSIAEVFAKPVPQNIDPSESSVCNFNGTKIAEKFESAFQCSQIQRL